MGGLLLVAGRHRDDDDIANDSILSIQFNDDKFKQSILTKMPFLTSYPSSVVFNDSDNEKLFVCGGWWNQSFLSTCSLYDFGNEQWTNLVNMNHEHQCPGICEWKERGNKIVVAGGYSNNKFVEEYDMHKDEWTDLPNLNKTYDYPALVTSNNILFCVGGVDRSHSTLGEIEFYDPRDRANKWIYVDSVGNYFKLSNESGAGLNCCLP